MIRFTLQLDDRPGGRVLVCEQCGRAGFHPPSVLQVVCPDCSPFLQARIDHRRQRLELSCRWAKEAVVISGAEAAAAWMQQNPQVPQMVGDSLLQHFAKAKALPVRIVPPENFQADFQVDAAGVVTMVVDRDVRAGEMVMAGGVPVGISAMAAQAGQMVEVKLTTPNTALPPREPPLRPQGPAKAPADEERERRELIQRRIREMHKKGIV